MLNIFLAMVKRFKPPSSEIIRITRSINKTIHQRHLPVAEVLTVVEKRRKTTRREISAGIGFVAMRDTDVRCHLARPMENGLWTAQFTTSDRVKSLKEWKWKVEIPVTEDCRKRRMRGSKKNWVFQWAFTIVPDACVLIWKMIILFLFT